MNDDVFCVSILHWFSWPGRLTSRKLTVTDMQAHERKHEYERRFRVKMINDAAVRLQIGNNNIRSLQHNILVGLAVSRMI